MADKKPESDSEESDEFGGASKKEQAAKAKGKKAYDGDTGDESQEYDEVLAALFEKVPPGEGDEFAAVKPWLGAIKKPDDAPKKPSKKEPKEKYGIDWIYGYRSEEARMNAQFNEAGKAVYPAAAVGVIFDYKEMKQSYFGGGKTDFGGRKQDDESKGAHSDDITALALSFSRKIVASGQNGQKPQVFLWDAETAEQVSSKRLPKGARLVTAIGISKDDKYVCAADAAEKITAHIFEVKGKASAIASMAINMKVVHLAWSPNDLNVFATAGKDHIMIVTMGDDKKCKGVKGKAKGGKIESQCSAAFLNDPKYAKHIITGGSDGKVYHWEGDSVSKTYDNNKGSVHSVACRQDEKAGGEVVLVGGNDKTLTVYKFDGKLTKLWSVGVDAAPRSCDLWKGEILMGLKNGSLVTMPWTADGKGEAKVVMTSHCDGEVWGLDVVDIDGKGSLRIITSADDNRVLAYDAITHKALAEGIVAEAKKKKKGAKGGFKGGASSMSSQPSECQSRAVAYSAELKHLAVATNTGMVTVREIDWAKVDAREPGSLDNQVTKKPLFSAPPKGSKLEWIEAMAYSPDSKTLAVGSHDNLIYLFETKKYSDKSIRKLEGHSSFITSLDWCLESKWIRTNCGAYELLFFDTTKPKKKERQPGGASATTGTIWADTTCKLGWNVQGIFPVGTDGSHINSVAQSKDRKLLASGDDYGLVCVYRNPLLEKHESSKYRGHSEFVTSVKFSPNDSEYIFSVGGQDQTCFQWKKGAGKKDDDDEDD